MKYTVSHEWVDLHGSHAVIGITDYAQKELGEIIYVELPRLNHTVRAGDPVVVLESTKAAIDLYSPLSGEIVEVNLTLKESPDKLNLSPENEGWLFKIKLSEPAEYHKLLDEKSYKDSTEKR